MSKQDARAQLGLIMLASCQEAGLTVEESIDLFVSLTCAGIQSIATVEGKSFEEIRDRLMPQYASEQMH